MKRGWILLVVVPLLVGWLALEPSSPPTSVDLRGIWDRLETRGGPPVQFYYFHDDRLGLFRFGTTALNHTETFRVRRRRGALELTFNKTGARHRTKVRTMTGPRGEQILVLSSDPRNGGRSTRYRRRPNPSARVREASKDPFARMWMHRRPLVGSREDFRIYQFRPADAKGHGTGWFHVGDFDEWTTEALTYHRERKGLHLRFDQRGESAFSHFAIERSADGRRLRLARDPRYFGRSLGYKDVGPNLMGTATAEEPGPLSPLWIAQYGNSLR